MTRAVEQKGWWVGPEVEGVLRHTRPRTVIVREAPATAEQILELEPAHVFFNEDFADWSWLGEFLKVFSGPVTVACGADNPLRLERLKKKDLRRRVRVVLRYWGAVNVDNLDPDDEVSVGRPYDLSTFRAGAGVRTYPGDYEYDK